MFKLGTGPGRAFLREGIVYASDRGRRQVGLSQELPVTQSGWILGSGWESRKEGGGLCVSPSENHCSSNHGSGCGSPGGGQGRQVRGSGQ